MIHLRIGPRYPVLQPALSLLAALALSSGCGTAEPEHPTVTGNWVGTSAAFGAVENWRLRMEESSDGTVAGTFSLRVERLVFSGTVNGTHIHPALALDVRMVFFGDVVSGRYEGRMVAPDSIMGTYQVFNEPARALDLDRLVSQSQSP